MQLKQHTTTYAYSSAAHCEVGEHPVVDGEDALGSGAGGEHQRDVTRNCELGGQQQRVATPELPRLLVSCR